MKLNQLYEFVELCYSSNSQFDTMMYSSHQSLFTEKQAQSYDECQLNGVIVNTKSDLDASNIIVMVDDNLTQLNNATEPVCLNMHNNKLGLRSNNEQNQTVLRHSSDFYKSVQSNDVDDFINLDENVNYGNLSNPHRKIIEKKEVSCDIVNIENNQLQQNNIVPKSKKYIKSSREKKPFACSQCDKIFVRKESLDIHLSVHSKIKPFICEICCKTFANEKHLKYHKRFHNTLYQCDYCAKSFIVPSKLERHLRIHTKTKPFVCPIENCGKSFSDKGNLEGHKLCHSNQKKFKCDMCSKTCRTNSQLKDHKKVHDTQSPYNYKCGCGKMYKWKSNLTVHMRTHDGHKCLRCDKEFEKHSSLVSHRKICDLVCGTNYNIPV